jgi:transposase
MEVTGTRQAFEALLQERGIYKRLGVSIAVVSNWKAYVKAGKSISIDKMEEILERAGATVVQEKVWKI